MLTKITLTFYTAVGGNSKQNISGFGSETPLKQKKSKTKVKISGTIEFIVIRFLYAADGSSDFPAEAGRYHLYCAYACPWAHRTLLARRLKVNCCDTFSA